MGQASQNLMKFNFSDNNINKTIFQMCLYHIRSPELF